MPRVKLWECKIGFATTLPLGADAPLRAAVQEAYRKLTGKHPDFCFSGWGGELTEREKDIFIEQEYRDEI